MRNTVTHALAARSSSGLGSAQEGVTPWWIERVTAVALVPLTLWFVASLIALTGSDYAKFVRWLRRPLAAFLVILLLIALFTHLALGLQVVIEDYIHSGPNFRRFSRCASAVSDSWPPASWPRSASSSATFDHCRLE